MFGWYVDCVWGWGLIYPRVAFIQLILILNPVESGISLTIRAFQRCSLKLQTLHAKALKEIKQTRDARAPTSCIEYHRQLITKGQASQPEEN